MWNFHICIGGESIKVTKSCKTTTNTTKQTTITQIRHNMALFVSSLLQMGQLGYTAGGHFEQRSTPSIHMFHSHKQCAHTPPFHENNGPCCGLVHQGPATEPFLFCSGSQRGWGLYYPGPKILDLSLISGISLIPHTVYAYREHETCEIQTSQGRRSYPSVSNSSAASSADVSL